MPETPSKSTSKSAAKSPSKLSQFFSWSRKGKKPVQVDVARVEDPDAPPSTQVSLAQLKQGYGEVVDTMKSVRSHLEQQADRSQQMLEVMRQLPDALKAIPQTAETQTRLLESIQANLDRQNETSGHLTTAITGLASAAASQEKALGKISDHMAEEKQTRRDLTDTVGSLNSTLGDVTAASTATRESMGAVVDQTRHDSEQMRELFQRSQKMNTAMVLLCLALATGALALGGYMAYLISRNSPLPPAPAPATPSVTTSLQPMPQPIVADLRFPVTPNV